MPPVAPACAAAVKPPLHRERNRRAAHEDEQRHDDVPEREAAPGMVKLSQDRPREPERPVERVYERTDHREEKHVRAPQDVEREQPFLGRSSFVIHAFSLH